MSLHVKTPHYLRRAGEARALAQEARDPTAKALLYRMAGLWEKLAERASARRKDLRRYAA